MNDSYEQESVMSIVNYKILETRCVSFNELCSLKEGEIYHDLCTDK